MNVVFRRKKHGDGFPETIPEGKAIPLRDTEREGKIVFNKLTPTSQIRLVKLFQDIEKEVENPKNLKTLSQNLHTLTVVLNQLNAPRNLVEKLVKVTEKLKEKRTDNLKETWGEIKNFLEIHVKPLQREERKTKTKIDVKVKRLRAIRQEKHKKAKRWRPVDIDAIINIVENFEVEGVKFYPHLEIDKPKVKNKYKILDELRFEHVIIKRGEIQIPHVEEPLPVELKVYSGYDPTSGSRYGDSIKITWSVTLPDGSNVHLIAPIRDGMRIFHTENAEENLREKLQESWKIFLTRLQYVKQYLNILGTLPKDKFKLPILFGKICKIIGKHSINRGSLPFYEWEEKIVETSRGRKPMKFLTLVVDIGYGAKCPLYIKLPDWKLLKKIPIYRFNEKKEKWERVKRKDGSLVALKGNSNGLQSPKNIAIGKWIVMHFSPTLLKKRSKEGREYYTLESPLSIPSQIKIEVL
ncbi:MAG: hypothetical protein B6U95_00115 [Thermofilum sp. ex4484_82]|nr:MAG: hypothetical protein B6U95_00115 [Thermofilum sp. ex4484_82]OYT40134.1 MAG: hypothetical protein B6U96_00115 [Archaeoglobales archaeon ex4484_92]